MPDTSGGRPINFLPEVSRPVEFDSAHLDGAAAHAEGSPWQSGADGDRPAGEGLRRDLSAPPEADVLLDLRRFAQDCTLRKDEFWQTLRRRG